jgi:hypothetical protein
METNPDHPKLLHRQEVSPTCLEEPLNCLKEMVGWLDAGSCQNRTVGSPPVLSTWLEPSASKNAAFENRNTHPNILTIGHMQIIFIYFLFHYLKQNVSFSFIPTHISFSSNLN